MSDVLSRFVPTRILFATFAAVIFASSIHPMDGDGEDEESLKHVFFTAAKKGAVATPMAMITDKLVPAGCTDERRRTALHYALLMGNIPLIHSLLYAGCSPSARDCEGQTAWHLAALCGQDEALAAAAYGDLHGINEVDCYGCTPLDYAQILRGDASATYLSYYGAQHGPAFERFAECFLPSMPPEERLRHIMLTAEETTRNQITQTEKEARAELASGYATEQALLKRLKEQRMGQTASAFHSPTKETVRTAAALLAIRGAALPQEPGERAVEQMCDWPRQTPPALTGAHGPRQRDDQRTPIEVPTPVMPHVAAPGSPAAGDDGAAPGEEEGKTQQLVTRKKGPPISQLRARYNKMMARIPALEDDWIQRAEKLYRRSETAATRAIAEEAHQWREETLRQQESVCRQLEPEEKAARHTLVESWQAEQDRETEVWLIRLQQLDAKRAAHTAAMHAADASEQAAHAAHRSLVVLPTLSATADIPLKTQAAPLPQTPAALRDALLTGQIEVVEQALAANQRLAKAAAQKSFEDKRTLLHDAAANGNTNVAVALLQVGASLNAKTKTDRNTPLHEAIQSGHLEMLEPLTAHAKTLHALTIRNAQGKAPAEMLESFSREYQQLHEKLFEYLTGPHGPPVFREIAQGCDLRTYARLEGKPRNLPDYCGDITPLHVAAHFNRADFIQIAEDSYTLEERTIAACRKDAIGRTPVHYAAASGHMEALEAFHNITKFKEQLTYMDRWWNTPATLAPEGSKAARFIRLADDFDERLIRFETKRVPTLHDATRVTAALRTHRLLCMLSLCTHTDALQELLDLYDEPPTFGAGITPLHLVTSLVPAANVDVLIAHPNVPIDARENKDRQTALHEAAYQGNHRLVAMLLDAGASATAQTTHGSTPLMRAILGQHTDTIKALLRYPQVRATIETPTYELGHPPLQVAARIGHADAIQLLLDAGAQIEARSHSDGSTALHYAAGEWQLPAVKVLIERGADCLVKSDYDKTPLYMASTEESDLYRQGTPEKIAQRKLDKDEIIRILREGMQKQLAALTPRSA